MLKLDKDKNLYIYTALIFVAAILIIMVAFFGQKNMRNNQLLQEQVVGISERAAQLSEENMLLTKAKTDLESEITSLKDERTVLQVELERAQKEASVYKTLLTAKQLDDDGKSNEAKETLATIVVEELTEEQKAVYDEIVK